MGSFATNHVSGAQPEIRNVGGGGGGGGYVWGSGSKAPSRRRHGGLGAEPPALENFAFFLRI